MIYGFFHKSLALYTSYCRNCHRILFIIRQRKRQKQQKINRILHTNQEEMIMKRNKNTLNNKTRKLEP
ncbi:hypothetical protein, partial [Anaerotignum sp.]|uniref:hypothetical protein n=1 Tax=Anaerotignum sp. TaxID=2039241 RepID=UPI0028A1D51D